MSLRKHTQDWEELADLDPCWAILSCPSGRFGGWDVDEFFLTGEREIEGVMEHAVRLGYPALRESALDFGCGIGRLTRPLAKYFQQCYGVDISQRMIAKAKELNGSLSKSEFLVNSEEHLRVFSDGYFDMIYTNIVLQHIPKKSTIKSYISEFVRTLKEGGLLVFQLPSHIPFRNRFQPRRRVYALLRSLGLNKRLLYERLRLEPIRMNFIPEKEIVDLLKMSGARLLHVHAHSPMGTSFQSNIYYVTR